MGNGPVPGMPVVDLNAMAAMRRQQEMNALNSRFHAAFGILQKFIALEKQSPDLPRCRELVNKSLQTIDYLADQIRPGAETAPAKIVKGA